MSKLLKYSGLIGTVAFLILAIFILTQRSCEKKNSNFISNDKVISDSTSSSTELEFENWKLKINDTKVNKYRDIYQIPTDEYVKGNKGIYLAIDLKDSISQTIILFPSGEYSFRDNEWKVIKSLDNVKSTIWADIPKSIKYKIFIEGQADITGDKTFSRKFLHNYVFDKIDYYSTFKSFSKSEIQYDSTSTTRNLFEPLKNTDLPLLRAAYLKKKLLQLDVKTKPLILEGEVTDKIGADYRNGKIILFVDTSRIQK